MRRRIHAIGGGAALATFVLFTLLVRFCDRSAIGPQESLVGLARFNAAVREIIGTCDWARTLSSLAGMIALATVPFYACLGCWQLVSRRSLKAVDPALPRLAAYYAVLALVYVLFEALCINCRPVLEADGTLEASYPSTHALLAITLPGASWLVCRRWLAASGLRTAVFAAHAAVAFVILAGRVASGVHWGTDIIGGMLLGWALLEGLALALPSGEDASDRARNAAE